MGARQTIALTRLSPMQRAAKELFLRWISNGCLLAMRPAQYCWVLPLVCPTFSVSRGGNFYFPVSPTTLRTPMLKMSRHLIKQSKHRCTRRIQFLISDIDLYMYISNTVNVLKGVLKRNLTCQGLALNPSCHQKSLSSELQIVALFCFCPGCSYCK
jgi:hypothetical protein